MSVCLLSVCRFFCLFVRFKGRTTLLRIIRTSCSAWLLNFDIRKPPQSFTSVPPRKPPLGITLYLWYKTVSPPVSYFGILVLNSSDLDVDVLRRGWRNFFSSVRTLIGGIRAITHTASSDSERMPCFSSWWWVFHRLTPIWLLTITEIALTKSRDSNITNKYRMNGCDVISCSTTLSLMINTCSLLGMITAAVFWCANCRFIVIIYGLTISKVM